MNGMGHGQTRVFDAWFSPHFSPSLFSPVHPETEYPDSGLALVQHFHGITASTLENGR